MPATCDGSDNDACDKDNDDDSRDIFHDALRAGNIGPIARATHARNNPVMRTQGKTNHPATHNVESHSPTTPVRPSAITMITRSSSVIVALLSKMAMLAKTQFCVL